MNKLISVVIVNYNGKKWLKKCLDSLRSQTYKDFEVILVDNASADGSIEFVENNFKEVKVVRSEKNLGFAGGNNLGIELAIGEFILLLNNDAWIQGDFLERIFSFYRNSVFDVVAPLEKGYEAAVNSEEKTLYVTSIDFLGHPIYLSGNVNKNFFLSGVCLFFSKRFYLETLGLDDDFFMYFEEIDWFWRLLLLKKKFVYVAELYIHHAGAGATGKGIKFHPFLWRNQNTLQMLIKNYKLSTLLYVLPLYIAQNVFEIFIFLVMAKPKIAFSYFCGWWFNAVNFKRTIAKRAWVQKNRKISDQEIMKMMYPGLAKADHLLGFIKRYVLGKSI
jgi:GT2 family glycosyltransferase